MQKRTKILITCCSLAIGSCLVYVGYRQLTANDSSLLKNIPFIQSDKEKESAFKIKKDPQIPLIQEQLANEQLVEKKELMAKGIQLFQHKPKTAEDLYTCYIDVPVVLQAKFLSVIFYTEEGKQAQEVPAKQIGAHTFVMQTDFFKKQSYRQAIVLMTKDGNYQWQNIDATIEFSQTAHSMPLLAKQLPTKQKKEIPANLLNKHRLHQLIQAAQNQNWRERWQQQQIGFERSDNIEAAVFDYSAIDDGKFSCRLQLASLPPVGQSYRLAIWRKNSGLADLHQYPFKQIGSRDFVANFNNRAHDNYAEGSFISYLLANAAGHVSSKVVQLNRQLFIPKYILKVQRFELIPQNIAQGLYQIQLVLNKNERVKSVDFDVWTKHKGKDDAVNYVTNTLVDNNIWQQTIDVRKVHFDDVNLTIKASVDLDLTGRKEMETMQTTIEKQTQPIYVNHRGKQQFAPENSIPAFKQANYEAIETDIHLTADKKWVIMHDGSLNRTTNGSGEISQFLAQQLLSYHLKGTGEQQYAIQELRIPSIEDYLAICQAKGKIPIIEVKTSAFDEVAYRNLIELVRSYQFAHTVRFISFHYQVLKELKKMMPEASVMYLSKDLNQQVINQTKKLGSRAGVNVHWQALNQANVQLAHQAGLQVGAWTVPFDQFSKMTYLGVDYITTNDA
ncbi:glycerophosphodiester phosphodiesterase [Enterococcus columbae]|uniref:GP-PDE domain-containing protein n=1 Tax=Enterococcus columbae DSM 7374 = ATCC 51263 TaxID=1121865 RepID=S1NJX1_9ENTE|nr:glycerophosphodiester phosphodiesterase family protein [Enterococcus columbae]EOT41924.1 hypothetical protein OMW_01038 [Enterococcus columbae DSM 7374 = ATCC 51263]EOW80481.1 hypothetical protein I568_01658 [Enterococcus columbae DSM 7374 = ATCC 51263]OJG26442.1 hypothetical protein RR47_GL000190 [Enterococcus columbae DSM 7374 = ATCC 51263]